MLRNGDFEGDWHEGDYGLQPEHWLVRANDREDTVVGDDGEQYQTSDPETGRVRCEHLQPGEPEQMCEPDSVHCLKLFGGQKAIHAWLYQEVAGLTPDRVYEFRVPVFVDTYIWDKEQGRKLHPNLHSEPRERAARLRMHASAGNGNASSLWFDEANVDQWHLNRHHLTWRFEASAETMTVGVELWNPWPIDNCGWFFDGLTLTAVEGDAPPSLPPGECECRGKPRVQYERTVHVIPGGTDVGTATAIFAELWQEQPTTVGPSYDDAGIGDLDVRNAVLHLLPDHWHQDFIDFFAEHYEGVNVSFADGDGEYPDIWDRDIRGELNRDGEWHQRTLEQIRGLTIHHTLSHSPHNTAAWAVNGKNLPSIQYHIWITETGEILYTESLESALYHDHTGYPNFHLSVGLAGRLHEQPPTDAMMAALVEVCVWAIYHPEMRITLETVKGHQDYYPDTECPGWHTGWKHTFYHELHEALGIEEDPEPDPAPDPPPPTPMVGTGTSFHAQAHAAGQMEYVAELTPNVFKVCHQAGMARDVHAASPKTLILYRKVWNDWHHYVYGYTDLAKAAADFIAWLMPEIREIDAVMSGTQWMIEGLNETIATGAHQDILRVVEFESHFARQIAALPYNVAPCLLNVAVGNPQHGPETEMLIPAAIASIETGGALGYHPYWPFTRDRTWLEEDWQHFAGRWDASWDATFRKHGVRPRYVLTESGPIGGSSQYHLDAWLGWRWINDWPRTLDEIVRFDRLCMQTVAGKEGRYLGHTLFTTGNVGWDLFQYHERQFNELRAALR